MELIGITEIAGSCLIGQKAYKESMKHIMNNYEYYGNGKLKLKKDLKTCKIWTI